MRKLKFNIIMLVMLVTVLFVATPILAVLAKTGSGGDDKTKEQELLEQKLKMLDETADEVDDVSVNDTGDEQRYIPETEQAVDYPDDVPYLYVVDGMAESANLTESMSATEDDKEEILGGVTLDGMEADTEVYIGARVKYSASDYYTHFFALTQSPDENNCDVYCVDPLKKAPEGGSVYTTKEITNDNIRKCMFYSYGAPGLDADVVSAGTRNAVFLHYNNVLPDDMENGTGYYMAAHAMLSYAFSINEPLYGGYGWDTGMQGYTQFAVDLYNAIIGTGLDAVPDTFKVYSLVPGDDEPQRMVTWEYKPVGEGEARAKKISAKPAATNGNSNYTFKGIEYGIYTEKGNPKSRVADITLTLDADGISNKVKLEVGTYYLREEKVPDSCGYILDNKKYTKFYVKKGKLTEVSVSDAPKLGSIELKKYPDDANAVNDNNEYSFAGAVYYVYADSACTKRAKDVNGNNIELVTTEKKDAEGVRYGYAKYNDIPFGTYYIMEKTPSKGFGKGTFSGKNVGKITLTRDYATKALEIASEEPHNTGSMRVEKSSANESITKGNSCYSLAGAFYKVYDKDNNHVGTFVTDENGIGHVTRNDWNPTNKIKVSEVSVSDKHVLLDNLPLGEYTVKETEYSKGFKLDINQYNVNVTADSASDACVVKSVETFDCDNLGITLIKQDSKTVNEKQGMATLDGAQFTVRYYNGYYDSRDKLPKEATRTWILETKHVNGKALCRLEEGFKVKGDEFYKDEKGNVCLPLGTITIEETKAPTGYKLSGTFVSESGSVINNGEYIKQIKSGKTGASLDGGNIYIAKNDVIRYDISFTKADYETKEAMANVVFRITSKSTGENHIVKTDSNGYYSSAAIAHSKDTNANDAVKSMSDVKETGIWFKSLTSVDNKVDDSLGALPYDVYLIEELSCPANEGHQLLPPFEIEAKAGAGIYNIGTLNNVPIPRIHTKVKNATSGNNLCKSEGKLKLIDTVSYSFLEAGKSYIVKGCLYDLDTKQPIVINGKNVTAEERFNVQNEYEVSKVEKCGTVDVAFELDAKLVEGKTLVVFEKLYDETGKYQIACHEDFSDADQTVYIPYISTVACGKSDTRVCLAEKTATITDTISYEGLMPKVKYTIKGTLVNKLTGQTLVDADGKEIAQTLDFVAANSSGAVTLDYDIDASMLGGESVVCFATLYYNEEIYATHEDVANENQTIHFPSVSTLLENSTDNSRVLQAGGDITLTDKVTYSNLIPQMEYEICGCLVDKDTGKPIDKGTENVVVKFAPEQPDGEVQVNYSFNSDNLAGKTVVAFEEIYQGDVIVAIHDDIEDKNQSISFYNKVTEAESTEYITTEETTTEETTTEATTEETTTELTTTETTSTITSTEEITTTERKKTTEAITTRPDDKPKDEAPKTGDENRVLFAVLGMVFALAAIVLLIVSRRMKR